MQNGKNWARISRGSPRPLNDRPRHIKAPRIAHSGEREQGILGQLVLMGTDPYTGKQGMLGHITQTHMIHWEGAGHAGIRSLKTHLPLPPASHPILIPFLLPTFTPTLPTLLTLLPSIFPQHFPHNTQPLCNPLLSHHPLMALQLPPTPDSK